MFLPNPGILAAGTMNSPVGQQLFASWDMTASFVVPPNVTTICVVAIGVGGSAYEAGEGGSLVCQPGGDLRYFNNIPVVPGETLQVVINEQATRLVRGSTNIIHAGSAGRNRASNIGFGFNGGEGWTGGDKYWGNIRGGGAGGYTSAGENGSHMANDSRGGGGTSPFGGGPGAASGASSTPNGLDYGGGAGYEFLDGFGWGGKGCVRIIWGEGRAFPNTNTGDL
ncbi:hypothetical protein V8F63_09840 [Brevundimonas sp. LF-1]|uniref:hypothetical protein n=1 Tax=Brevundimonas sp. LF-1 TaxID=3126100 RepID=UPI0030DEB98C